jgi:aminoglycoside/choline kinase family phosphotransferase
MYSQAMSKTIRCPRALTDIDAAWLGDALQQRYPGVEVLTTEIVDLTQGTSTRMRLRARYADNGATTPPKALFAKSAFENGFRDMMTAAGIYEAEVRAFSELLPNVNARTPALYASAVDETDGQFLLIMEDMVDAGISWYPPGGPISVDEAEKVLAGMATWHAPFWDDPALNGRAWLPTPQESAKHDTTKMFVQTGIQLLQENWSNSLPEVAGAEELVTAFDTLMEASSEAPRTLLHGDPHLGNLGRIDGEPVFLDWQVIRRGHAALDLSYFLSMSLEIEDRRAHEEQLLRDYLDRRTSLGGGEESFDSLWASYRAQSLYGLLVWAATPEFMQPSTVTVPYVTRALAAFDDLDTLEAIRAL